MCYFYGMGNVVIRIAGIADAELIADMSRQTFYDTFAAQNTRENMDKFMQQSFSKEALIKEVGEKDNIFLLAYDGQEPLGYVRLRTNNNPPDLAGTTAMEIARIYTVKEAIGKGVGSALMEDCISVALANNCSTVWLGVWENNDRAIAFYKKWGFEEFATHVFMLGDDPQTDLLMKKKL
jgi:diamine N-acetyltransferase